MYYDFCHNSHLILKRGIEVGLTGGTKPSILISAMLPAHPINLRTCAAA
jgi:hypothetical protein